MTPVGRLNIGGVGGLPIADIGSLARNSGMSAPPAMNPSRDVECAAVTIVMDLRPPGAAKFIARRCGSTAGIATRKRREGFEPSADRKATTVFETARKCPQSPPTVWRRRPGECEGE
jgi:hypothetical protein